MSFNVTVCLGHTHTHKKNLTQLNLLVIVPVGGERLHPGLILPVPGQVSDPHVYLTTFLGRNLTNPDKGQD